MFWAAFCVDVKKTLRHLKLFGGAIKILDLSTEFHNLRQKLCSVKNATPERFDPTFKSWIARIRICTGCVLFLLDIQQDFTSTQSFPPHRVATQLPPQRTAEEISYWSCRLSVLSAPAGGRAPSLCELFGWLLSPQHLLGAHSVDCTLRRHHFFVFGGIKNEILQTEQEAFLKEAECVYAERSAWLHSRENVTGALGNFSHQQETAGSTFCRTVHLRNWNSDRVLMQKAFEASQNKCACCVNVQKFRSKFSSRPNESVQSLGALTRKVKKLQNFVSARCDKLLESLHQFCVPLSECMVDSPKDGQKRMLLWTTSFSEIFSVSFAQASTEKPQVIQAVQFWFHFFIVDTKWLCRDIHFASSFILPSEARAD